jgi:CBS domain-containing protein
LPAKHSETKVSGAQKFRRISWIQRNFRMKIKEIIKNVKTISPGDTVKEAASVMSRHNIGSLVVVNSKKKVVGIVTERDIIEKVNARDKLASRVSIEDIMTSKVITIDANALIDDAVYLMVKHRIKKLPVLDNNELIGIVTSTDIVANSSEVGEFYLFD